MSTDHSHSHAGHGHGHDDHSGGGGHHEPTNFFSKYVFSLDHKVIAVQFTFVSLFFVIIGGGLALAVRYQLAWPFQNVPFKAILPGAMTAQAPEPNVALWHLNERVKFKEETEVNGVKLPEGAEAKIVGFPKGLAVTILDGTIVKAGDGAATTLDAPVNGFVDKGVVIGDYNYKNARARAKLGTKVTGDDGTVYTLDGVELQEPDGPNKSKTETARDRDVLLPIRAADTPVTLHVFAQNVKLEDDKTTSVSALDITDANAVPAASLTYVKDMLSNDAYIQLFTMHATIMIFFVLMPMLLGGFGNYLIPLMIGARDMAFPKLNAFSFWLSVPAGILMVASFWVPGGAAGGGWTMYSTLSDDSYMGGMGTTLWVAAIGLVGFSTIVGTLNYITTTINMRAPGMTMFRMPLTVWGLFITAILGLLATPVLTAAAILLLLDRTVGTTFFLPAGGGQPLLWQHLFWFFGHPEVYILILPTMGLASDVLAVHARKPIFGYRPMIFAMAAIGFLGFIVWGHHMFQSGMNPVMGTTFMASTIMIAVPSAIKVFNWLGTLWGGNIRFTAPMLFALGFVSMFVIGGLSGVFMASAPVDIHIHDTYFIVAHIHYVFFGGTLFGVWAGVYHWFPKVFGRALNERWGKVHFWLSFIGFNGTFFLMHILGLGGHPRRYASVMEYPTLQHLQPMNVFMSMSALMLGMAQIPFFYNLVVSTPRKLGRAATAMVLIGLGAPVVIGATFYDTWSHFSGVGGSIFSWAVVATPEDGVRPFWPAFLMAAFAGLIFTAITLGIVWGIWALGKAIQAPKILTWVLYITFLPAFLSPLIIKPDFYFWIGMPHLAPQTWWGAIGILALFAIPGLIWGAKTKANDVFGATVGDNPWNASSLEWATSSPPPFVNFHEIPTVYRGPYEYGSPVVKDDYLPQPHVLPPGTVEPSGH